MSKDFNITPVAGDIKSLTWVAFPSSGVVGTPITAIADPVSVPASDSYDIAKKSGDCSWDDSNDALSFTNTTKCVLTVTTIKTGYNPLSKDFSITPTAGDISTINWVAFPSSGIVATPIAGISEPVSVPAADSYDIARKSGGCSWDDNTNTLSFTDTSECILTVTTTKVGYNSFSKDFSITPKPRGIILDVVVDYSKINILKFTVKFNTNVVVNTSEGTPQISFTIGGVTKHAPYQSGTGTSSLAFEYSLKLGEVYQGNAAMSSPIDVNGGSINDVQENTPASLVFTPPSSLPDAIAYQTIYFNDRAFAKIKKDGSVVTWGDPINPGYGGDSSSVASDITSGVSKIFSTTVPSLLLKQAVQW